MPQQVLTGSCLCGALSYKLIGEPIRFFHCHCSRCRKSSGTGHASNVFVKGESIEWTGDTSQISTFMLPEAKRFSRTFCNTCGGPLPREVPEFEVVFIPAGTLDVEPNIKPQARIFQDSKTSWSCSEAKIPCFSGYPE
ncbi:MAG TPA: GFA family protein [Xanthomonadales bacterium]|nr:GFA family protein [Xanthomonadales bacterium]